MDNKSILGLPPLNLVTNILIMGKDFPLFKGLRVFK